VSVFAFLPIRLAKIPSTRRHREFPPEESAASVASCLRSFLGGVVQSSREELVQV
jgi:hypothetical protein